MYIGERTQAFFKDSQVDYLIINFDRTFVFTGSSKADSYRYFINHLSYYLIWCLHNILLWGLSAVT